MPSVSRGGGGDVVFTRAPPIHMLVELPCQASAMERSARSGLRPHIPGSGSGGGRRLPIPGGGGAVPHIPVRVVTAGEGSANSGCWRTAVAVEVKYFVLPAPVPGGRKKATISQHADFYSTLTQRAVFLIWVW